jgi:hypothetical protein
MTRASMSFVLWQVQPSAVKMVNPPSSK